MARALRENEECYRALFEFIDCVYLFDLEGRFLDANPAVLELLGYQRDEVLSLDFSSFLDDDQLAKARELLAELKETGTHRTLARFRLRCKSGEYVDVESTASLLSRDGQPYAVLGLARDVTQRRRAEEALRESQALLNATGRMAKVGGWKFDLQTQSLTWTDEVYRIHEVAPDFQPTQESAMSFYGPEAQLTITEAFRQAIEEGQPFDMELPFITAKGNHRWVHVIGEARVEHGQVTAVDGTFQDITAQKRVEEALQDSEKRFKDLSSMTSEGVMIHEGGIIVDANRAFAELIGHSDPDDLIGKNGLELTPLTPESRQRVQAHMRARSTQTYEVQLVKPDGSTLSAETRGQDVTYRGRPARLVSMRDISERKRAEEALLASEEQLRQSQKMEAVGQLAGGIAHDFNNLLSAILGYSDLLLAESELSGPRARKDLEEIKHAAERAAALTEQILAFSRRQVLRLSVVSLNEVLEGMEPLLRRTLGEDVNLFILEEPDLGSVEADVHQFEQVIMNLAVNSRDAMPSGGQLTMETANVELDQEFCRTHTGATPGSHVMLRVSDTGAGMNETTRKRVFEPFFTTKAPGEGSGLGLAVAYGIIKQSRGSIFVESEPGEGTTFTIYLPQVEASTHEGAPFTSDVAEVRGTETILVVEDEISLRNLVVRILGGLGYQVLSAGTAEQAVQVAKQTEGPIDLLLTDVVLPGGAQGNQLARDLLSLRPNLAVLYMSGYARDALVHAGRLERGVSLLKKPFTPQTMAATVRTVLNQRRTSA